MSKAAISGYLILALAMCAASACRSSLDTFTCASDRDCQLDGVVGFCEAAMLCSFTDTSCLSGRRFGKLAGETSNECVLEAGRDAATAAVDAAAVDADLPRADAMSIPPVDAMPEADAEPACGPANAASCAPAVCPKSVGETCCVYQTISSIFDCNDVCSDVGKVCDGAFHGDDECSPAVAEPCEQNVTGNVCYCL